MGFFFCVFLPINQERHWRHPPTPPQKRWYHLQASFQKKPIYTADRCWVQISPISPPLSTVFENGENNVPASCQDACSWPIHPAQWSSLHTVNLSHDYFVLCCICSLSPGNSTCVRVLACWFASRESPRKGQLVSLLLPSFPLSSIEMVSADHLHADPWLQPGSCVFTRVHHSNITLIFYRPSEDECYRCSYKTTKIKAFHCAYSLITNGIFLETFHDVKKSNNVLADQELFIYF